MNAANGKEGLARILLDGNFKALVKTKEINGAGWHVRGKKGKYIPLTTLKEYYGNKGINMEVTIFERSY